MVPDGSVLTAVVGDVDISDNLLLESLGTDLDGLATIGNSVLLDNNPALETIDTFNELASLPRTGAFLLIRSNNALTSITGFQSLETVDDDVTISNNPLLTSIAGLGNLTTVNGDLDLFSTGLSSLAELTSLTTVTGTCSIELSLLATAPQNVQDACGFVRFTFDGNLDIDNTQNVTLTLPAVPAGSVLTNVTDFVDISDNQLLESLGTAFDGLAAAGRLAIAQNPVLETIDTFNALASLETVFISDNAAVTSITGFQALGNLTNFVIQQNAGLTGITGFQVRRAPSLPPSPTHSLTLSLTHSLSHFQALQLVQEDLFIFNNTALTSLAGLGNLMAVGGNLTLEELPSLLNLNELTGDWGLGTGDFRPW